MLALMLARSGLRGVDNKPSVEFIRSNPHARFYLDVKSDEDKATNWEFESGSMSGRMLPGWTRNSLKIGDAVQMRGSQAKDGSNLVNTSNGSDDPTTPDARQEVAPGASGLDGLGTAVS
jgi:hypothetical protein